MHIITAIIYPITSCKSVWFIESFGLDKGQLVVKLTHDINQAVRLSRTSDIIMGMLNSGKFAIADDLQLDGNVSWGISFVEETA